MGTNLYETLGLLIPGLFAVVLVLCSAPPSVAGGTPGSVIEGWGNVKPPPPPELRAVRVDPATTALLILDIEKRTTNMERRPRAVASVPVIRGLLERARESGMAIAFSTTGKGTPETILPQVAPLDGEPVVKSSVDKFYKTNLETILQQRQIQRVIVVGTAAEGAVLHTATGAALRGLDVIVPVDGLSSSELYAEQYVCWHLVNAPGTRKQATLTRTGLIDIGP